MGRVTYISATDEEALRSLPALLHASKASSRRSSPPTPSPRCMELAPTKPKDHLMVVNICGRGDKDLNQIADHLKMEIG